MAMARDGRWGGTLDVERVSNEHSAMIQDPLQVLSDAIQAAIVAVYGEAFADADPMVRPSASNQHGDYQANVAMGLAKRVSAKPRDVAQAIVDRLDLSQVCAKVDIAGPGFINFHLTDAFLAQQVQAQATDEHLGLVQASPAQRVVVDYGGPNVAKEMHVGHLRSAIIGDAIVRVLTALGHHVIRQNHIGDWGTQFGMLIQAMIEAGDNASGHAIGDLNKLYQAAKKRFDDDAPFAERARQRVVKLQGGDEETLALWRKLVTQSESHFQEVYSRLGVLLTGDDIRGESFYNPRLPGVVKDLEKQGLLKESQGAAVVFPPGFGDKDKNPLPLIVRKGDGGYLYATTDLAAARYRVDELAAQRVIYVTDVRQAQHFAMVFQTLRDAGWAPSTVRLDHVPFGTMLGQDRKPFKTRSGDLIRLVDLLDEAIERADAVVKDKRPEMAEEQRKTVAAAVGVGALKYADLSTDRIKDYVFDWTRMLSFDGNTAPYLQNAYVRVRAIFRKGNVDPASVRDSAIHLGEPAERALAAKLLLFPTTAASVGESLEPHRLCNYLYELAAGYHKFYEACPVLTAGDDATRASRLALSDLTARVLQRGLQLLGIEVVEQM